MHQERNRPDTTSPTLHPEIKAHIQFLSDQVKSLEKSIQEHLAAHPTLEPGHVWLDSIVGNGPMSAAYMREEIGVFQRWGCARQLAAYSGLPLQHHQAGTSVHGKVTLARIGNAHLRYHLYFPSLVAIRRSLAIAQWRQQLLDRGKNKMQVVGAVMHQLLRLCFGVLKSGQDFDSEMIQSKSLTT